MRRGQYGDRKKIHLKHTIAYNTLWPTDMRLAVEKPEKNKMGKSPFEKQKLGKPK